MVVRKTCQNDGVKMLQAVKCDDFLLACVFSKWQDNADVVEFVGALVCKPLVVYSLAEASHHIRLEK